ncbi:MAG: substrate-binding domain-containing protein [Phycisphaerales bacterium]
MDHPEPVEGLEVRVRRARQRAGWTQAELARRAGLSRAGVGAIEAGRVSPSTAAALALAAALGTRVESLFRLAGSGDPVDEPSAWRWFRPPPIGRSVRFWWAEIGGHWIRIPTEPGPRGVMEHDGVGTAGDRKTTETGPDPAMQARARTTLVLAGCDPAAGILAARIEAESGVRVLCLERSSGRGLDLLQRSMVHAAGTHLAGPEAIDGMDANARAVGTLLGRSVTDGAPSESIDDDAYCLLPTVEWDCGLAIDPRRRIRSAAGAARASLRWIGRDPGSGAALTLSAVLGRTPELPHVARDHAGVVAAVRGGWADAGPCVRLAAEDAELGFLTVHREPYEWCVRRETLGDDRLIALLAAVRSPAYHRAVAALPGHAPVADQSLRPVPLDRVAQSSPVADPK